MNVHQASCTVHDANEGFLPRIELSIGGPKRIFKKIPSFLLADKEWRVGAMGRRMSLSQKSTATMADVAQGAANVVQDEVDVDVVENE
jgi:hypothetical protein